VNFLYDIGIYLFRAVLGIVAVFSEKIKLFLTGRKDTFKRLENAIHKEDRTLWFHCASLGEFEQGRPVIEALSKRNPDYKIVLSFFSPSGFEIQKDYPLADVVVYLPLDTKSNAKKFLKAIHPSLAVFVKYEFWPNLLNEIKKAEVPAYLISGIFRNDQVFFKPYGGWMRAALEAFSHFFVQNNESVLLLEDIGIRRTTRSGDTRFDRVHSLIEQDNTLDFLEDFTRDKTVVVAGSTWPKDEELLIDFINDSSLDTDNSSGVVFIIAPHHMDRERIQKIKERVHKKCMLYSEGIPDKQVQVFILDTIGLLTKVYSYASVSYVGGGFDREGVHNVLEPAVFGAPIVIGPVFEKYQEAVDLVELKGCLVTKNSKEFKSTLSSLLTEKTLRDKTGEICREFIEANKGATEIIVEYIDQRI
jgi:3-deoxy-D-manno-octulosonic-acid transferase